jgi:hypothetical protein
VPRIFHDQARPHLGVDLSRMLELAAAALGDHDDPIMRIPPGSRVVLNRQRLAAVAVLGEREAHLSRLQRLTLGRCRRVVALGAQRRRELACALLAASCSGAVATEHPYLALITPSDEPGNYGEGPSS